MPFNHNFLQINCSILQGYGTNFTGTICITISFVAHTTHFHNRLFHLARNYELTIFIRYTTCNKAGVSHIEQGNIGEINWAMNAYPRYDPSFLAEAF